MANYRIRVEVIGPNGGELDPRYAEGLECDKFCILTMREEEGQKYCTIGKHDVSLLDMAEMLGSDKAMAKAVELTTALNTLNEISESEYLTVR